MANILLLSKKILPHYDEYRVQAEVLGHTCTIASFPEVLCTFSANSQLHISVAGHDLESFDVVFYRGIGGYSELEKTVSEFCRQKGKRVVDRAFVGTQPWIDRKSFEYTKLSLAGLPVVRSTFGYAPALLAQTTFPFPCIVKKTDLSHGDGVFLIESQAELERTLSSEDRGWVMQEFLPNDGDVRAFVIGDRVVGAMLRQSAQDSEFRNNLALGGTAQLYELDAHGQELATAAAACMGYEIAGVDLIRDARDGSWRILEVNRAPEFDGIARVMQTNFHRLMIEYVTS